MTPNNKWFYKRPGILYPTMPDPLELKLRELIEREKNLMPEKSDWRSRKRNWNRKCSCFISSFKSCGQHRPACRAVSRH